MRNVQDTFEKRKRSFVSAATLRDIHLVFGIFETSELKHWETLPNNFEFLYDVRG